MTRKHDYSDEERIKAIECKLGSEFSKDRKGLLIRALTREDFAEKRLPEGEKGQDALETLGDAILGAAVVDLLYRRGLDTSSGLSGVRDKFIDNDYLSKIAVGLEIAPYIIMDEGEENDGRRDQPKTSGNTLEALIGAIHLDMGFGEARRVVKHVLKIPDSSEPLPRDDDG